MDLLHSVVLLGAGAYTYGHRAETYDGYEGTFENGPISHPRSADWQLTLAGEAWTIINGISDEKVSTL